LGEALDWRAVEEYAGDACDHFFRLVPQYPAHILERFSKEIRREHEDVFAITRQMRDAHDYESMLVTVVLMTQMELVIQHRGKSRWRRWFWRWRRPTGDALMNQAFTSLEYQEQLVDELPVPLRNKHRFYNIRRSITNIHFPETFEDQENAMKRVSFEEFYFFQASVIQRRLSITRKQGIPHKISDAQTLKFVHAFPFELTGAQKRVVQEIRADMEKESPMLRLLHGDVGSGKTLAALYGCWAASQNGFQSCVMAPTEILARQHHENIAKLVEGGALTGIRPALLVGSLGAKEKKKVLGKIYNGGVDLVVGTHALLGEEVSFKNLSFAVIDEQHKFGVRQRALLTRKGTNPHVLIMTATPIPRTLCITLYGDLDLSVLDEMPPNRGKVRTLLFSDDQAPEVYARIRAELQEGRQAYVVYPLIEESEKTDLKAAQQMFRYFQKDIFKDFQVGLVHGRMKPNS